MGKILCIGQSVYDITISLNEPFVEDRKYVISDAFRCAGGPAMNAACLCGKWGAEVILVSRIGNDEYGKYVRQSALAMNVDLSHLLIDDDRKTSYSYILANGSNGTRTLFNFPGERNEIKYTYPKEDISVILSDGHEPEISIGAIQAYPHAISVLDAGTCREDTRRVARYVDYLVCSEDFAREYTGKRIDLEQWEQCESIFQDVEAINGKHAVITLGDRGLLYKEHGRLKRFPAYKTKALDTTGAGDIFHGAFAYGLDRGMTDLENLKVSSMAASISVETIGGYSAIPDLDNVLKEIKKREQA